ncbi:response regulator [Paenibacillus alvei]|uniref:Response regulator n=1 Tax=Paenibacillus alvei TaxID=44250 RepID=A0AAP7DIW7_PAEAL|nr:response regulator [Paenibacillus alvei]NOJ70989.1 response regulator [Paenibacillus alvei]
MKLLIVDDEVIIRTGIHQVIDWLAIGIAPLQPAASGEEAWQRIQEEQPHIVMTDIRMGAMSGLELADLVRSHYPSTEVIMLSGYDDFAYAQQAMRAGAQDYILKTGRPEEIMEAVLRAKQRLEVKRQEASAGRMSMRMLKTQLLDKVLTEGMPEEESARRQILELLHFEPISTAYQVIMLTVSGWKDEQLLQFAAANFIEETLQCDTLMHSSHMVLLWRLKTAFESSRLLTDTLSSCERLLKCSIFAACGSVVAHFTETKQSYGEAEQAFAYAQIANWKGVISYADIQHRTGGRIVCTREEEAELFSLLTQGNRAALAHWIQSVVTVHMQDEQTTPDSLLAYTQSILVSACRWLERMIPEERALRDIRHRLLSDQRVGEALYHACCAIMERYQQYDDRNRTSSYIQRAMFYIREHLHQSLSLQQVAAYVHVNPNHFSEVFKREAGVNYIDFVTAERMRLAKELLTGSERKISHVASDCGYEDVKYFCKLFKKHTGLSPSQYRLHN